MRRICWFLLIAPTAILIMALTGCQDPSLKSDISKEEEKETEQPSEVVKGDYQDIRKSVIGRTFATLTLGSRQFSNASVSDINDEAIILSVSDKLETIAWSDVPKEVRLRWGFNPFAGSVASRSPKETHPSKKQSAAATPPLKPLPEPQKTSRKETNPANLSRERAAAIAQRKAMLEAQGEGVRMLESDLSRQTLTLQQLQLKLRTIRSQDIPSHKGQLRIKRDGGTNTQLIDRKAEAREVEKQIRAQEQLVAQLTSSVQKARIEYQRLEEEFQKLF